MLSEKMIEKLISKGFKRWTKGTMDRLYINAHELGLYTDHYKSGNICYASFNGEEISHAHALRMLGAKIWVDIATGDIYSKYAEECLVEAAKALCHQASEERAAELAAEAAAAEAAAAEAAATTAPESTVAPTHAAATSSHALSPVSLPSPSPLAPAARSSSAHASNPLSHQSSPACAGPL